MTESLSHRGPDFGASKILAPHIGLGHRRLSIIDLSLEANQPLANETGDVWIVYNGEVYNYRELRSILRQPHKFASQSDTEVIVHLYEEEGINAIEKLDGMFAFCVVDLVEERLILARDPFGIKPLYYSLSNEAIVFGSEIKSLLASGLVSKDIDSQALNDYFDFHWIPAPRSIFKAIRKLPPAHYFVLDLRSWDITTCRYWKPTYNPVYGKSKEYWTDQVANALATSVKSQLVADVPVGSFLSGGIDSTVITDFAANSSSKRFRAFTAGFENSSLSEVPYAEEVSNAIGCEHSYAILPACELKRINALAWNYDEPFADSSLLPTAAICRAASGLTKVVLSGDGGDELFAGYRHHQVGHAFSRFSRVPDAMLRLLTTPSMMFSSHRSLIREWCKRLRIPTDLRMLTISRLPGRESCLSLLPDDIRESQEERMWHVHSIRGLIDGLPAITQLQMYDLLWNLPSDILVKVDRASMAVGLEVRVPFLSKSVSDVAFQIPEEHRFRIDETKPILRSIVARKFGARTAYRRKQGFGIPLKEWMSSVIHSGTQQRLLHSSFVKQGLINKRGIESLFQDLARPRRRFEVERGSELFALLMFEAWWNCFMENGIQIQQDMN